MRALLLPQTVPAPASQMGVDTLVLTGAAKVEKDYFGSHLVRYPERLREALIEGLAQVRGSAQGRWAAGALWARRDSGPCLLVLFILYIPESPLKGALGHLLRRPSLPLPSQSGDVHVPKVVITKQFQVLVEEQLQNTFPPGPSRRVLAHPYAVGGLEPRLLQTLPKPPTPPPEGAAAASAPARILLAVGPEGGWDEGREVGLLAVAGFEPVSLGPRVLRSDVAANALLALAHGLVATWDGQDGALG